MATRGPIKKKIKKDLDQQGNEENDQGNNEALIIAQLKSVDGEITGPPLSLPVNITPEQLEQCNIKFIISFNNISFSSHLTLLSFHSSFFSYLKIRMNASHTHFLLMIKK